MQLHCGPEEVRSFLGKVIDADPIDRVTARSYVTQQGNNEGIIPGSEVLCVPMGKGMNTGGTIGTERMHSFSPNLVFPRSRDGGVLLPSPKYSERM